jgi:WD40 repeat protein
MVSPFASDGMRPRKTWRFAAPAEPSGVTVWDSQTGEEVIILSGHDAKLTTVAFSPDGRRIAAASDRTFSPPVWDADSGELLFTLDGHEEDTVRAVAFSPTVGSWRPGAAAAT